MPRDSLLAAAREVIREMGYSEANLEAVAARARMPLAAVKAEFPDKARLLDTLLRANSPLSDLEAALDAVQGDTAEDLLRDAMRKVAAALQRHEDFFELAVIDAQVNNGAFLSSLSAELFPKANALLGRVKATKQTRPVMDMVFARTLIALLIGFIISDRAVPGVARTAMRLFPQRAWLDGMTDLLLYGVLEDDAR
jgi:AcrR family transcriptional regulator